MILSLASDESTDFLASNGTYSTLNIVPDFKIIKDADNKTIHLSIFIQSEDTIKSVTRGTLYLFLDYELVDRETFIDIKFTDMPSFSFPFTQGMKMKVLSAIKFRQKCLYDRK